MALTAKKVYAILKRQISDMEAKLNSPVRYRGTVATADLLPLNPDIGDMYNIESKSVYGEAGMNVAWNGVVWDTMGAPIDMSLYFTKEEAEAVIQRLVTEYFEKNPVKPGATTEQAQQIEQNKKDVALLKEDISTKITKFYASSQGETHLADSDNGKIMDMMLYGRSEQKQYSGKNLLKATLQTTTMNGVTCTDNGDGTYTLNGTATTITAFDIVQDVSCSSFRLVGCPAGGAHDASYELQARTNNLIYGYDTGDGKNIKADENFFIRIRINAGINCNNLLFKPMIVDASLYPDATYDDFEPYTGGIPSPNPDYPQEIKSVVNPTVKVCGKNLAQPLMPTTTVDGVTVTNNGDGTYTLNGTAIANATFRLDQSGYGKADNLKKYKGTYTFSRSNTSYEARVMQHNTWKQVMYLGIGSQSITKKIDIDDCFVFISTSKGTTYNNVLVDLQIEFGSTATAFEPYHEQTATLPYTLNAIPVSSGGNVTINGQQYIADYIDVENGKIVKYVKKLFLKPFQWSKAINKGVLRFYASTIDIVGIDGNKVIKNVFSISSHFTFVTGTPDRIGTFTANADGTNTNIGFAFSTDTTTSSDDFNNWILNNKPFVLLPVLKEELPLTSEQILVLKKLSTYYPTTNISVNSEQLDGYTVFNYPISMENGWNYVKHQIGDTREYIYDMDARTQDTDLQAAEAYVNSEYAVALTELEV